MYLPRHFEPPDAQAMHALMREHPLATLVVHGPAGLQAHHLPLLWTPRADGGGVLRGHVARANPVWRELAGGCPALAVFHGPQAYVSPSWYATKQETGKVVPTWNYAVVHAHGTLHAVDDAAWLRGLVGALTDEHERGRAAPWGVADAPPDFVQALLKAIVGIEMSVQRLEGKWKASQNQPEANLQGVVRGLDQDGETAMAALVQASAPPHG